eukprot:gene10237-biopygen8018
MCTEMVPLLQLSSHDHLSRSRAHVALDARRFAGQLYCTPRRAANAAVSLPTAHPITPHRTANAAVSLPTAHPITSSVAEVPCPHSWPVADARGSLSQVLRVLNTAQQ